MPPSSSAWLGIFTEHTARMEDACPAVGWAGPERPELQSSLCHLITMALGISHRNTLSLCPLTSNSGLTVLSLIGCSVATMKCLKENPSMVPDTVHSSIHQMLTEHLLCAMCYSRPGISKLWPVGPLGPMTCFCG